MKRADLAYFKGWFNDYVAQFHAPSGASHNAIILKEQHTRRTCEEIVHLGRELGLADSDLLLAETSALLHDLGRFPQWERYRTFIDSKSEDHAILALKELARYGVLERIPPKDRAVITESIRHHNVREVPTTLAPRQLFFSRLLRDADKLDIWSVITQQQSGGEILEQILTLNIPSDPSYASEILADLKQARTPDFSRVKTRNDMILLRLGWVFDLNFSPSFQQVLERGYIEQLCSRLPDTAEIRQIGRQLILYVKSRSCTDTEGLGYTTPTV